MTRVDLRRVPTEALQRELKARQGCVDCRTLWSRGWYDTGDYRQRCFTCQAKRRLARVKRRLATEATMPLIGARA